MTRGTPPVADNSGVKLVRRLAVLAFALALAAAAASPGAARVNRGDGAEAGSLEVQHGIGILVATMARGAIIGRFERGRIAVSDRRGEAEITVFGADETVERGDTTVYRGRELRFKVAGSGWRIGIQAQGLDASLVGRGVATLRGVGTLSLDGEPFRTWPPDFRSFVLGAPAEAPATIRNG